MRKFEVVPKRKLFLVFPTISMQNLVNFEHREGHWFRFQSLKDWKSWKIRKESGPLVSRSGRLKGSRRSPMRAHNTACGDAMVTVRRQWPPPTWSRLYLRARSSRGRSPPFRLHSRARPAIALLWRSLSSRLCWRQPPPSATRTRCCIPELRLHAAVLVDHTTGAPPTAAHLQPSPSSPTPPGASPACHTPLQPSNCRWRSPVWAVVVVHPSSSSLTAAKALWWAPFHPTGTRGFPLVRCSSTTPPSSVSHRRPVRIDRSSAAAPVGKSSHVLAMGRKGQMGWTR
jgi:hypothetical protein